MMNLKAPMWDSSFELLRVLFCECLDSEEELAAKRSRDTSESILQVTCSYLSASWAHFIAPAIESLDTSGTEKSNPVYHEHPTKPPTHQSHLSHEAVCVGVLLILEHDVWVVVAHKFIEALGVACNLALRSAAGAQVVF